MFFFGATPLLFVILDYSLTIVYIHFFTMHSSIYHF